MSVDFHYIRASKKNYSTSAFSTVSPASSLAFFAFRGHQHHTLERATHNTRTMTVKQVFFSQHNFFFIIITSQNSLRLTSFGRYRRLSFLLGTIHLNLLIQIHQDPAPLHCPFTLQISTKCPLFSNRILATR